MSAKHPGGLCSTCINARFCIYLKARARGAIQCELFDAHVDTHVDFDQLPTMEAMYLAKTDEPCTGLCSTCDLVSECRAARPQGGVWHCEAYC